MGRELNQLGYDVGQQINPLAIDQSSDHGKQRQVRFVRQADASAQCSAVVRLVCQTSGIIVTLYIWVVIRIPGVGIDAVEDTRQNVAASRQQILQPHAQRRLLYFLRVSRADSGNTIGVLQACFQETQISIELHAIRRKCLWRQPKPSRVFRRKVSLVC